MCVIKYVDITNEESFTKMKDWVEELQQNVGSAAVLFFFLFKT